VARGPKPKLRSPAADFPGIGVSGSPTLSTTKSGRQRGGRDLSKRLIILRAVRYRALAISSMQITGSRPVRSADFLPNADPPLRGSRRSQAVRPKAFAAHEPEDTSILPFGTTSPKALHVKVTSAIS